MGLEALFELHGYAILSRTLDMSSVEDRLTIGQGGFDPVAISLEDGTGEDEADLLWHDERTVADGATDHLDLAGSLIHPVTGAVINFAKIKLIIIVIDTPDGVKGLRVGPQNVSGAWQGPWGGTGATVYETVRGLKVLGDGKTGFAVTAGTGDILGILGIGDEEGNPCVYRIVIVGTSG